MDVLAVEADHAVARRFSLQGKDILNNIMVTIYRYICPSTYLDSSKHHLHSMRVL